MPAIPQAERLCRDLGYRFRDSSLLDQALTHRSLVNEAAPGARDNERMELLGDAILDFTVTELLMDRHLQRSEGELSKLRATLVSEPTLAQVARELRLGECLRLGRGEELSGGRDKPSILSDAFEALIAAIYLDSRAEQGISAVAAVVRALFWPRIEAERALPHTADYKTELQELVQKRFKERVTYRVLKEEGPDHGKLYEVAVSLEERECGRGRGRSKKEAEQAAAQAALTAHFGAGAEEEPKS